jgi:hypothetical protein
MRHSDINLTMNRYSHVFRGAESKAVGSLPDFTSQGKQSQIATGTDGKLVELPKGAYKKLTKKFDFDSNSMSSIGFGEGQNNSGGEQNSLNYKPLQMADLGTKKEPLSSTDTGSKGNTPARTRTWDLRIRNPLLCPTELRAQRAVI